MFGLPDTAPLSHVVFELCRVHPRTIGEHHGLEAPLLHMLETAIGSSQGRGSTSGVSGASGVLNLGALDLWNTITATVGEHWPGRGDLSQAKTPLMQRLEVWTSTLAGTDEEVYLLEMALYWHESIRNLLEPPKQVPLRGVTCPNCKQYRVLEENANREYVYQPILMAYASETPVRVECKVCTGTWFGNDLAFIGASEDFLTEV